MKNTRVQKMVAVALFAAIGLVLQYIAFRCKKIAKCNQMICAIISRQR